MNIAHISFLSRVDASVGRRHVFWSHDSNQVQDYPDQNPLAPRSEFGITILSKLVTAGDRRQMLLVPHHLASSGYDAWQGENIFSGSL